MATTVVEPGHHVNQSAELDMQSSAFQALEQRVLRAIELLRKERELRAAVEQQLHQAEEHTLEIERRFEEQTSQMASEFSHKAAEMESHTSQLRDQAEQIRRLEGDLSQLQGERDQVRQRVERLLQHLDEFTGE
jgi:predicted nuclease with TOPRIM domain